MTTSEKKEQRRIERRDALLRQVLNAGFDLETSQGQNDLRATLEFAHNQRLRCETATKEITKYGIAAVFAGALGLMVAGFWDKVKGLP